MFDYASVLLVLPPLIIVLVAVLAIKCTSWLPALRQKLSLICDRKSQSSGRRLSRHIDPSSESSIELESGIAVNEVVAFDSCVTLVE